MKTKGVWVWVVVVSCLCAGGLVAQQTDSNSATSASSLPAASQPVPRLIMFSGTVKDLTGKPLTGPVDLNFAIYKEQTDAAPLWQESQTLNVDEQGRYTVLLGAMQQEGLPTELFTTGEARWLGVSAGKLPEQPRTLLVSVPYALKAGDAETLGGKPASAYALAQPAGGPTAPGGLLTSDLATPGKPKGGLTPNVTGTGTRYYIPMWTDTLGTVLGNSVIYQSSGLVGIGTTTPAARLDVAGSVGHFLVDTSGAQFRFTRGGANYFQAATAGGYFDFVVNGRTPSDATASLKLAVNGDVDFMAGKVGIGTLTPAQKLDVSGNLKITGAGNAIIFPDGTVQSTAATGGGGGAITGVTAGTGLSGGGTTGNVTLSLASASCTAGMALTGLPLTCQAVATAGSYATLGSNAFVGNQTITGNLTVSADQTVSGDLNLTGTLNGWTVIPSTSQSCTILGSPSTCLSANILGGYTGLAGAGGGGHVVRADSIASGGVGGNPLASAVVGGNTIALGVVGGTISGGGGTVNGSTYGHTVSNHWATVAGGAWNTAGDTSGPTSWSCCQSIGGGHSNTASGSHTTVGGGYANSASGKAATVPGGWNNTASGWASFAAGCGANAANDGSFVWSGYNGTACTSVTSSVAGQFIALAPGGFEFFPSTSTSTPVFSIAPTTGNVTATGSITAASFVGNGSGLTGVSPSGLAAGTYSNAYTFNNAANSFTGNGAGLTSLTGANVTGTVANATNATSATTATTATNATQLGGVAASGYPRLATANTYTSGKQTFVASTTSAATLKIPSGVAPTTPATGDFWNLSGILQFYDGTHTNSLTRIQSAPTSGHLAVWSGTAGLLADGGAAGTGAVSSVGLVGTANQITVTGASPITTSGSWTLSFPSGGVTLPGTTTGTFSGNGAGLTGVTVATATNALALGSVAAANYARLDIGNSFTGNQTVTGNLSITGPLNSALVLQPSVTDTSFPNCTTTGNCVSANVLTGYMGASGGNSITAGVTGATIAGGGGNWNGYASANTVTDDWGTVGGGLHNQAGNDAGTVSDTMFATVGGGTGNYASGGDSTVGGGSSNNASGSESTVAGGGGNTASGVRSTVAGGAGNDASGSESTVPGGFGNNASGSYSFAGGCWATAANDGDFVWGGGSCAGVSTNGGPGGQFVALAPGGVIFYSNTTLTAGVTLAAGGGSWSSVSDRNVKANFKPVGGQNLLARLNAMPMSTWNYKAQEPRFRHMGPMAQDFYGAFGLGEDDKHIDDIDGQGVALAGVQALYRLSLKKDAEIQKQQAQIRALTLQVQELEKVQRQMAMLEARLAEIEARTAKPQPRSAKRAAPAKPAPGSVTLAKVQF